MAWSQVQNKLQLAMPNLPQVIQQQGVKVSKSTRNYLMIVNLYSDDGSMSGIDVRDYAVSNIEKVLSRVQGVGEVQTFGAQYAMRIWLDTEKLTNYSLTMADVVAALRVYNVEISAGQFGGTPAVDGQRLNASITVQNLLKTPEEFANIPVRTNPDGSVVRVNDVGRTELGTENYDAEIYYNDKPSAGLAVRQAPGANALATADAVKAKMEELSRYFPKGMKFSFPYETTPFVKVAIEEVVKTLFEAIVLVFLVMYLFMGNMRATLIPTIAVPVVILGTFAVLALFGFSINMLTMFAMVLAIGLLVDDAIVVVENVERIMSEEGLSPREATRQSMDQITPALIGIGLVLSAVFGPMAFMGGSTGVIYRQFSVTVIASMLLSVVVALILTPVLCAALLKPVPKGHEAAEGGVWILRPFFRWFDRLFFRARDVYLKQVSRTLNHAIPHLLIFGLIIVALVYLFRRMPTAYLPDEDQGMMMVQAILPPNATLEMTQQGHGPRVRDHFIIDEKDAVDTVMMISGSSFAGQGQNMGMAFVKLRDWDLRQKPDLKVAAVAQRAMGTFSRYRDAMVFAFAPPAVMELGTAKGFDFQLEDRGGLGHEASDGRPQSASGNGREGSPPRLRPAQRHGGRAGVPARHRLGKGRRTGRSDQLDPSDDLGRVRQRLCERLHSRRARQARVRAGRLIVPHAAGRHRQALRPQQHRQDGSDLGHRRRPVEHGLAQAGAIQRVRLDQHSRRSRAGPKFRRSNAGYGGDRGATASGHRLRLDRHLLSGAHGQLADRSPLHVLRAGDLPVPGSAVRELAGAHLDSIGAAPGRDRRRDRIRSDGPAQ